ncbi:hypothetical protein [Mycolicibacterium hippocampi]|uniref:DNA-binding protein n=1 Tax=Mycolicibacterium hippocampi TaxID=659824 RepID=A0A7I9ZL74_9MYCO|nr:hypothetical protein [Mycolicibacterium hippocampi]GFH01368.1 hypothetical protein MHIP_18510 [Mycolicibacterium hippocampi]
MATNSKQGKIVGTTGSPLKISDDQQEQLDLVRRVAAKAFGDDTGSVNVAVNAAMRYLKTDPESRTATLDDVAEEIRETRDRAAFAAAQARGTVIVAVADGWSENGLATRLGLDRMTIRKWLGKERPSPR